MEDNEQHEQALRELGRKDGAKKTGDKMRKTEEEEGRRRSDNQEEVIIRGRKIPMFLKGS